MGALWGGSPSDACAQGQGSLGAGRIDVVVVGGAVVVGVPGTVVVVEGTVVTIVRG